MKKSEIGQGKDKAGEESGRRKLTKGRLGTQGNPKPSGTQHRSPPLCRTLATGIGTRLDRILKHLNDFSQLLLTVCSGSYWDFQE